jgi:Ca2+-binding RTX toxin-like protein
LAIQIGSESFLIKAEAQAENNMAIINGDEGNNFLNGTLFDDLIQGFGGTDVLFARDGQDTLDGGSGSDFLFGGNGDDSLNGGLDNDIIYGERDNDTLNGDAGNDLLFGGSGADYLIGDAGKDTLIGGIGDDILIGVDPSEEQPGQLERDTLIGGWGKDTFVLGDAFKVYYDDSQVRFIIEPPSTEPPPSYALIVDFEPGQDIIVLKGAIEYELQKVSLPNGDRGLGIFFDADGFKENGAEQLIGIIQSKQPLDRLQINLGRAITTIT